MVQDAKVWFNKLRFEIVYDIEYTNTKPYSSSFILRLSARHDGYDEIAIKVLSDKILVEYNNKDIDLDSKSPTEFNYVYAKSPINIDLPDYVKRVLKTIQNEIQDLSNTPDRVTQTVKIYGTIFDENPYGESLGKVYIDEYFTINDETEYEVSHNSFKVEQLLQSSHGELIAITDRQEILEAIIPTQKEFENLVQFVKKLITTAQRIA